MNQEEKRQVSRNCVCVLRDAVDGGASTPACREDESTDETPDTIIQGGICLRKRTLLFLMALFVFAVLTGCASGTEPEAELSSADGGEFTDIAGHPLEEAIREGLERGLYAITPDGRFRPDDPATLGEFLRALWNLSGQPDQSAADWATKAGYLSSAPDDPVTRQEAMSILYAHSGAVSGMETLLTGIYNDGFRDSGEISGEGRTPLYWGYYNILIRETEPGLISPSGTVSRGDMANILIRYADTFLSESPEN